MGAGVSFDGATGPDAERHELSAFVRLRSVPRLGERGILRLVQRHGSGAAALSAVEGQESLWPPAKKGAGMAFPWPEGTRVLPMTSPHYPQALMDLSDPPPLLFLKGREDLLTGPCVAVVGARKATHVGRRAAEALGRILSVAGVTVVSGLALGIDGQAHRGALRGGGKTIAVLGSGFQCVHPSSHGSLAEEVGEQGLLVSEFYPDEPARPHHFPKRNRIIAALSEAVIVVEAGRRSGALITVDHALDLGREILAVPGSIENAQASGTNALLRDGARVVPSPEAALDELQHILEGIQGSMDPLPSRPPLPADLEPLWDALAPEPRTVDELARLARWAVPAALAGLSTLELEGLAQRCPGMRFRRDLGVAP